MGKFVVHGIVVEEPKRTTTSNGIDCVTLLVEEKFRTAYGKDVINVYSVDFMGKAVTCIPEGIRLVGSPVVITGSIRSREYKEKYYNDLSADGITIIDTNAFVSKPAEAPKQVSVDVAPPESGVVDGNLEKIEVDDDDLPF